MPLDHNALPIALCRLLPLVLESTAMPLNLALCCLLPPPAASVALCSHSPDVEVHPELSRGHICSAAAPIDGSTLSTLPVCRHFGRAVRRHGQVCQRKRERQKAPWQLPLRKGAPARGIKAESASATPGLLHPGSSYSERVKAKNRQLQPGWITGVLLKGVAPPGPSAHALGWDFSRWLTRTCSFPFRSSYIPGWIWHRRTEDLTMLP